MAPFQALLKFTQKINVWAGSEWPFPARVLSELPTRQD